MCHAVVLQHFPPLPLELLYSLFLLLGSIYIPLLQQPGINNQTSQDGGGIGAHLFLLCVTAIPNLFPEHKGKTGVQVASEVAAVDLMPLLSDVT